MLKDKKKELYHTFQNPVALYAVLSGISLLIVVAVLFFTRGELLSSFFFHDTLDTGMDFFHSIEYVATRSPYKDFNTLYPPLANLFFYLLVRFVPEEIRYSWPVNTVESVAMRGSSQDLRVNQATLILFLLFLMVSVIVCYQLFKKLIPGKYREAAAFFAVFSYGFLYAVERGNIIILTIPLMFYFIRYRNSSDPVRKELALIFLALAAGLKIYPSFLGLLLIKDRDWKGAARCILYGISSVILPCFFLREGLSAIKIWLSVLFNWGAPSSSPWSGTGAENILFLLEHWVGISFLEAHSGIRAFLKILLLCIMVFIFFMARKEWESILCITICMLLYQNQALYILIIFLIPFICFLMDEEKLRKDNAIPYIGMLLFILPIPVFNNNLRIAFVQAASAIIVIWFIIKTVNILRDKKKIAA